jgi:hypothetical protein
MINIIIVIIISIYKYFNNNYYINLQKKQMTHPDMLCRGYPTEFRDYFAHCSALGFEDRPDYRYLKRVFKDLFDRQGCEDDGCFDWDVLKKQQEAAGNSAPIPTAAELANAERDNKDEDIKDASAQNKLGAVQTTQNVVTASNSGKQDGVDGGGADGKEGGGKKSIITSIRNSLFGSRTGQRQETTTAQTGQPPATAPQRSMFSNDGQRR